MAAKRTYRGIGADERRAKRRQQLLDAALDVWGGPSGDSGATVTMTGICKSAGLTERYFYESFPNLDSALSAVADEIAEELNQATIAALADTGDDPLERVTAFVTAFVETLTADPRKGRVVLVESLAVAATRPRREIILRRLARLAAREARKVAGPAAWSEAEGPLFAMMFVGGVVQSATAALDEAGPSAADVVAAAVRIFRDTTMKQ